MREREKGSETEGHVYKKNMLLFLSSYPDTHKTHKDFVLIAPSCVTQHHLFEIITKQTCILKKYKDTNTCRPTSEKYMT